MRDKLKQSVGLRIFIIGIISLVLLIPATMVGNLVHEREQTRNKAIHEVSEKWGNAQTIAGPVLSVPMKKYYKDKDGTLMTRIEYAHFLPDDLTISGSMEPEIRYRGIYQIILYGSNLKLSGKFSLPDLRDFDTRREDIFWKDAFVSVGISDMKGIRDTMSIRWNNSTLNAEPGIPTADVLPSGVSSRVALDEGTTSYTFSLDLNLNGSRELNFVPAGKETKVALASNWNSPSFQGNFLPEKREIAASGFTASWKVLQLNRNYPQKWIGKKHDIFRSSFGVNLMKPVDQYQQTTRTTKYAIMFIVMTFAAFFIIEILNKKAIHPMQYFLVGLALVLFYSLLLSLSEHIFFSLSYLLASSVTVALITAYTHSMFASRTLTTIFGGLLSCLYTFLFILLQREDYALLLGSAGLFIILALFMYLTRKVDWYTALVPDAKQAVVREN